jgi:hypothetical protein
VRRQQRAEAGLENLGATFVAEDAFVQFGALSHRRGHPTWRNRADPYPEIGELDRERAH